MMTRSNQLKGTNKASFDRFDRKLAFVSYSVVLSPNDITLYRAAFLLFSYFTAPIPDGTSMLSVYSRSVPGGFFGRKAETGRLYSLGRVFAPYSARPARICSSVLVSVGARSR